MKSEGKEATVVKIADWYNGEPDEEGRTFDSVLLMSDGQWDSDHGFIQIAFPTDQPSMFNGDAPLVTPEDAQLFQQDPELRKKLVAMFNRFLEFLGLYFCTERLEVDDNPSEGAGARRRITMREFNHNFLRMTRVLRSLTVLGQPFLAKALHAYLLKAGLDRRFPESAVYWKAAINAA